VSTIPENLDQNVERSTKIAKVLERRMRIAQERFNERNDPRPPGTLPLSPQRHPARQKTRGRMWSDWDELHRRHDRQSHIHDGGPPSPPLRHAGRRTSRWWARKTARRA
jgi:hypothetical protein